MPGLRLLADDLTGALDSAAAFAPCFGKVRVVWGDITPTALERTAEALAFDSGTRELNSQAAAARLAALASFLASGGADAIRFFKVDSLLRGHAGRELLAILGPTRFDHIIVAPAIPFQRRITRGGRQMIAEGGVWRATGEDIAATLSAGGMPARLLHPGDTLPPGVSICDAETDADLDAIVASAAVKANVLWVGAAGLAGALARSFGTPPGTPTLPRLPLLGLIGTDHAAMTGQLSHSASNHLVIGADLEAAAAQVAHHLAHLGAAFVTCAVPKRLTRSAIETTIADRFAGFATRLNRPAALFVSGGETLRHLATRLGVTAIDCTGQFEPGAPVSLMSGGVWDGMVLISKSGAFGTTDFLSRLVAACAAEVEAQT